MNPLDMGSNHAGINQWLEKGTQFVSKNEWKTSEAAQKALDKLNQTIENQAFLVKRTSGNISVAINKNIYYDLKNQTIDDLENKHMNIKELLLQHEWPSFLEKKFNEAGTQSMGTSASYSISEVEVDGEKKYRITQTPSHQPLEGPKLKYEIDLNIKEYKKLQSKGEQKAIHNYIHHDLEKQPMSIEELLLHHEWPSFLEKKFNEAGTKSMGTSASYSISEVEVDGEKKYRITQTPFHQPAEGPKLKYEIDLNTKEYKKLQSKVGQK